jgi:membrane protein DedA with SNARE-associated domain
MLSVPESEVLTEPPERPERPDDAEPGPTSDAGPDDARAALPPSGRLHTPRWVLPALIVPLIGLVIAAQIGDALAPTLVDTHPLWLISLNSRTRNLVLVVNQVDLQWYYLIGFVRLLVSDPLFYLLGWFYGDRAVRWLEKRSVTARRYARDFERIYQKAAYPLVFIAPNNPICLLAGASGMRPAVFFTLNIAGTLARLWLITILGETFEAPIDWLLDFIAEYRWYLLAVTVSIFLFTAWRETRSPEGEIHGLVDLEHEIEQDLEATEADRRDEGG